MPNGSEAGLPKPNRKPLLHHVLNLSNLKLESESSRASKRSLQMGVRRAIGAGTILELSTGRERSPGFCRPGPSVVWPRARKRSRRSFSPGHGHGIIVLHGKSLLAELRDDFLWRSSLACGFFLVDSPVPLRVSLPGSFLLPVGSASPPKSSGTDSLGRSPVGSPGIRSYLPSYRFSLDLSRLH